MKIYFLIPIFNEEKNLNLLFNNLNSVLKYEEKIFVFVDDFSQDNSISLINTLFKKCNYKIITKKKNIGPGDSFNQGFEWIIHNSKSNNDLVVTLEADNTSDILILERMVTISKLGYDLVLASIYAQGGGFDKTSLLRKIISFVANMFIRLIFDIKVLTLSSFYRVYSIHILKEIKHKNKSIINENGFVSMIEILLKAIKANAQIIEVPMILYSSNRVGKSKMKIVKTIFSYLKFLAKFSIYRHRR